MQGKVEICGVNTAKLKVLTNDEITRLLHRTKEGDLDARQELISGNLRLVLSVIQKFLNRGENVDDLFQVGCIGLIKAIDNFDISQNVRFSTYGVPMIISRRNAGKGDCKCPENQGKSSSATHISTITRPKRNGEITSSNSTMQTNQPPQHCTTTGEEKAPLLGYRWQGCLKLPSGITG